MKPKESETKDMQHDVAQVLAAQRGDPGAVEQLLLQNWGWLRALVAGIVHRSADVDDVLQEVSVKVITKINTVRQAESFKSWLACTARREALRWRHLVARQGVSLDHEAAEEPVDSDAQPTDEKLAADEERNQMLDVISQLPTKYREVLLLYHSGQSYKQIAETLELALTTVQIRLVRARKMIMEMIQDQPKPKRRTNHESAR